ncbi:hypothetical protein CIPAW_01G215900 [Carya illinoinensis]|uniref:Uncharacterized protein n=1 Tax=Carya illinoinensis TaxID=32201 RepID=A0A8T1RQM6_CARIL|nr:hypothetical protein CIPAW_01G215900 [Carya illinoinensis]
MNVSLLGFLILRGVSEGLFTESRLREGRGRNSVRFRVSTKTTCRLTIYAVPFSKSVRGPGAYVSWIMISLPLVYILFTTRPTWLYFICLFLLLFGQVEIQNHKEIHFSFVSTELDTVPSEPEPFPPHPKATFNGDEIRRVTIADER